MLEILIRDLRPADHNFILDSWVGTAMGVYKTDPRAAIKTTNTKETINALLAAQAKDERATAVLNAFLRANVRDHVLELLRDSPEKFKVAVDPIDRDVIYGFVCEGEMLYVRKTRRRFGVGTALYKAAASPKPFDWWGLSTAMGGLFAASLP